MSRCHCKTCCTCRGDVDDRVLLEAMLPLLETLAASTDVRPLLHSRFDMQRWFASQVCTHSLQSLQKLHPRCRHTDVL